MKLDIGGGLAPAPDHTNLDPVHGIGPWRRRIQEGIPVLDATISSARCSHLMEHVPSGADRVAAFNEVHRVLKPGGTFEVIVPLFPGYGAIADPTHVSLWVEQSFWYFTGQMAAGADYGIKLWELVSWTTTDHQWGQEGRCVLRKPA